MILYLVRHGESSFNAEGRIQGQLDTPLSDLGQRQAAAVGELFRGRPIDAIYTSPLQRARSTAALVAEVIERELIDEPLLMEIHAGVFQGLVWSDIVARFPDEAKAWKSHDPEYRIPGGESRVDLMTRGEVALRRIRERAHQQVIVVSHGGLLTAALKSLLGVPAERNPFSLYNCSVSMIDWTQAFRLLTLNELDHLRRGGVDLRTRTGDL